MSRYQEFYDSFFAAMEAYNEEVAFIPDDEVSILDKIKRLPNRYSDIPGTDEIFEKYKEVLYNYYKVRPNRRVEATKKLIKSLQDSVDKFESSNSEEFHDS